MSTPLWTAQELTEATGGTLLKPFDATGVSIDTRTLQPGDLFVALQGEGRDGHAFVAEALAKGAAGAMVHFAVPGADRLLQVDDTLAALARLGGFARSRTGARVVAVTGSVGKTTTKEMLRAILAANGPTHAAVASYNNHWGLPLTLARTPHDAVFCIVEIGMNHPGEIAPLARLARPHVAVITAIENAHVGHLGSIEAIADEKAAIMRGLEPGGRVVLPIDSPLFPRLRGAADAIPVTTFGAGQAADARLIDVESDADGSSILADIGGKEVRFRLQAPGRHMAMNALASLAVTVALGLDPIAAARALAGFVPVTGRGLRRPLALAAGNALLLDESYNGNGASMRAALEVLRLQPARRRIAVLGDMLELGEAGPTEHAALAPEVVRSADLLFACGPLMRQLFDAMPAAKRAAHAADSTALAAIVAAAVLPGDAILVKGSLGTRMKTVVLALEALATAEPPDQPKGGPA
ncbi:MAG: UDP-N-acetylmuramoyl-tripeptide--D-alanyl-D-alanine ligase [Acetobacteraceae bacterium]|nr:UDP-N-acetylmuramoyl-tripeptide--D-alanyl-D-alanine ligase [Acetobacteraceae bacterium]